MKTSEHLFYLIKSLSKAEKRSFKLFAKQYSKDGQNNYTMLFDAIDKQETYDHQALIAKLESKINTKNISTLKVQLNELILRNLRLHTASHDESLKIRQNFDYVDILFQKGLYPQAKKVLDKTKELARKKMDYNILDRLAIMEFNIAIKQSNKEALDEYLNKTYPEVSEARKKNEIWAEFEYLTVKMRLFLLESTSLGGKQTEDRLNEIVSHPLLNENVEDLPANCQMDYHIIWGHYHYAFNHPQETYFHRKRALDLIEEHGVINRIWLTHARFLLIGLSTFKMFDEFDEALKHITDYIASIPKHIREANFADEIKHTLNNIKINRDLDSGNYSSLMSYVNELETLYQRDDVHIDNNLRMAFYFNFCYAHLANGNYRKALRWSNKIFNDPDMRNLRLDSQTYLRIMEICIHYALGNYELIKPLVKSSQRFLKKQNRDIAILVYFLKFANLHFTEAYSASKEREFDNAVKDLRVLTESEEGKIAIQYFEFVAWLKSIYTEISMEDAAKEG